MKCESFVPEQSEAFLGSNTGKFILVLHYPHILVSCFGAKWEIEFDFISQHYFFFLGKTKTHQKKASKIKNNNPSKHLRFVATSPLFEEVVDIQNQNCIINWLHAKLDQLVLVQSGASTLLHYSLSPVHFLTSILPLFTEGHTANRAGEMRNSNSPATSANYSAWGWNSHGGEQVVSAKGICVAGICRASITVSSNVSCGKLWDGQNLQKVLQDTEVSLQHRL